MTFEALSRRLCILVPSWARGVERKSENSWRRTEYAGSNNDGVPPRR